MTTTHVKQWLDLLEGSCAEVPTTCLDIIIDQAGSRLPLLPSVLSIEPALPWQSLFEGLPEEGARDLAPILVRVDLAKPLQRQWLLGLMHALRHSSQLLTLGSRWVFPQLAHYLTRCLVASHRGTQGLLRYYDPRVFPLLFSHVLAADQQQQLLRPAMFWSWLNRDGRPQHLSGSSDLAFSPEDFRPIELSDSQVSRLSCGTDAAEAVATLVDVIPEKWGEEQRFQTCYTALLEATANKVLAADQRAAYVRHKFMGAAKHPDVPSQEQS